MKESHFFSLFGLLWLIYANAQPHDWIRIFAGSLGVGCLILGAIHRMRE